MTIVFDWDVKPQFIQPTTSHTFRHLYIPLFRQLSPRGYFTLQIFSWGEWLKLKLLYVPYSSIVHYRCRFRTECFTAVSPATQMKLRLAFLFFGLKNTCVSTNMPKNIRIGRSEIIYLFYYYYYYYFFGQLFIWWFQDKIVTHSSIVLNKITINL